MPNMSSRNMIDNTGTGCPDQVDPSTSHPRRLLTHATHRRLPAVTCTDSAATVPLSESGVHDAFIKTNSHARLLLRDALPSTWGADSIHHALLRMLT